MPKQTRNSKVLKDFVKYCNKHPEQRFWQALRNWSGYSFIYTGTDKPFEGFPKWLTDTFYWENKND